MANRARYERMIVEALLLRYECLESVNHDGELADALGRLQAIAERT